jgi:hypothetical protein
MDIDTLFPLYEIMVSAHPYEFTITPIKLYKCTSNISINYVVMMEIIMYDMGTGKKLDTATIPYYVSDGFTNDLHANLLFPFVCTSMKDDYACPYTPKFNDGVIIKYYTIDCLYSEQMYNTVSRRVRDSEEFQKMDEGESRRQLETYKEHTNWSVGISSILGRLGNILDFILCCLNKNILFFNDQIASATRPNKKLGLMTTDKFLMTAVENPIIDVPYIYRKYMCIYLKEKIMEILHHNDIKINNVDTLPYIEMTAYEFNKMINVCEGNHESMGFTNNFVSFSHISLCLATALNIKGILNVKKTIEKIETVAKLFDKWNASCRTPTAS